MATTDELLDLEVGLRQSTFRLDLLGTSLNLIGSLGADADSPPIVTNDVGRTTKRTMTGLRLPSPADLAGIDPLGDRLRPVMVLENGDTFDLGVLLFADLSRAPDSPGQYAELSLLDQTFIVDQPIAASITVGVGANLASAAERLLLDLGLPLVEVDQSGVVAATPLTWPVETSTLEIVNRLGDLCGCYPLFFTSSGVARLMVVPDIASGDPDVTYGAGSRVYGGTIVESDDQLTAPNRFLVIDTAPSAAPIFATYEVPASAPHSIASRGFAITEVIRVQGLPTVEAAAAVAAARGQTGQGGYARLTFQGAPDPRHDTHSVIEFDGVLWREQSWSLPLEEGAAMAHVARRVYA